MFFLFNYIYNCFQYVHLDKKGVQTFTLEHAREVRGNKLSCFFTSCAINTIVGVPFCCAAIVIIMPAVVVFWNEFFNLYILSVVAVMLIPV